MHTQTLFKPKSKVFPMICRGTTGMYVKQLQLRLQDFGAHVLADGLFDSDTEEAVEQFQCQHSLQIDGIVSDRTWNALLPTLQLGMMGDEVKRLQIRLNCLMGTELEIDGIFGMRTAVAVKQFQAKLMIPIHGMLDRQTWDLMLRTVILSND